MGEAESIEDTSPITFAEAVNHYRSVDEWRAARPHRCIIHPDGGSCPECEQEWVLVDGKLEKKEAPDGDEAREGSGHPHPS